MSFCEDKGESYSGTGKQETARFTSLFSAPETTGNRLYFYFLVRQFYLMVFSVDQWKPARFSMNLGGIIKQSCEAEAVMIETKMDKYINVFVFIFVSVFVFANTR